MPAIRVSNLPGEFRGGFASRVVKLKRAGLEAVLIVRSGDRDSALNLGETLQGVLGQIESAVQKQVPADRNCCREGVAAEVCRQNSFRGVGKALKGSETRRQNYAGLEACRADSRFVLGQHGPRHDRGQNPALRLVLFENLKADGGVLHFERDHLAHTEAQNGESL